MGHGHISSALAATCNYFKIIFIYALVPEFRQHSGIPREEVWGVQPPPRNSEDIGGVLDRISKKNRRLNFLL